MEEKEALLRQRDEAKNEAAQYENQVKILLNKRRMQSATPGTTA